MRLLIIIILLHRSLIVWSQENITKLELISISQLIQDDDRRFDLSGLECVDGKYYVIADKEWNNFIYEITFAQDNWFIASKISFSINEEELGMEALAYCNGLFYMANEDNGLIYSKGFTGKAAKLNLNFQFSGVKPWTWGNAGWEGLAIDCKQQIMYLAKERQPRMIYQLDMKSGEILDQFNIPETHSNDFSDIAFSEGYLYLLERNGNYITKVDPSKRKVITKGSYRHICSYPEPDGKLYNNSPFGMAEALILTQDEIWIGIDNNGMTVSNYARKTYNLQGNKPVILKFKRPEGF